MKDWQKRAERELRAILKRAGKTPIKKRGLGDVSVTLVGSAAMTRLNGFYRGKRRTTDVLSFPVPREFRKWGILGELVICLPVMKAQARQLGHKPEHELRVLLVHGLLHLLGFDHEKGKRQAKAMEREEKRLLGRAGLIGR